MGSGVRRRTYHSGGSQFNTLPSERHPPAAHVLPTPKNSRLRHAVRGSSSPGAAPRLSSANFLRKSFVSLLSHENPTHVFLKGPGTFSHVWSFSCPMAFERVVESDTLVAGFVSAPAPRVGAMPATLHLLSGGPSPPAAGLLLGDRQLCVFLSAHSARSGIDHEGPDLSQPVASGAIIWGEDSHGVKWHCHSQKNAWSLPV